MFRLNLQLFAATPVQGFDVSVSVLGTNGPALVGEFQEITINIDNQEEDYMTLNSRMPQLLDGEVRLDGTLKRGFIDTGNAVQTTFGAASLQPGTKFSSPRYVISATINAPSKGLNGRYNLTNCLINKLSLTAQAGKGVMTSDYTFRAEGIEEA